MSEISTPSSCGMLRSPTRRGSRRSRSPGALKLWRRVVVISPSVETRAVPERATAAPRRDLSSPTSVLGNTSIYSGPDVPPAQTRQPDDADKHTDDGQLGLANLLFLGVGESNQEIEDRVGLFGGAHVDEDLV
jgi:hypothetical protein